MPVTAHVATFRASDGVNSHFNATFKIIHLVTERLKLSRSVTHLVLGNGTLATLLSCLCSKPSVVRKLVGLMEFFSPVPNIVCQHRNRTAPSTDSRDKPENVTATTALVTSHHNSTISIVVDAITFHVLGF